MRVGGVNRGRECWPEPFLWFPQEGAGEAGSVSFVRLFEKYSWALSRLSLVVLNLALWWLGRYNGSKYKSLIRYGLLIGWFA